MGANAFYSNAEACAYEILHQKLMKEAQRSTQQAFMELSALRSFFGQGQLIYCIPFGGIGQMNNTMPIPFPLMPSICSQDTGFMPTTDPSRPVLPSPNPPPPSSANCQAQCAPPNSPGSPAAQPLNQQSIVRVNVKNQQNKIAAKPDECNIGKDGINVTIDLREYLPAEISLDVEEKSVEIRASHVNPQGAKTFARRYDLPACIVLDSVRCVLSHDGYLMFSAAWIKME